MEIIRQLVAHKRRKLRLIVDAVADAIANELLALDDSLQHYLTVSALSDNRLRFVASIRQQAANGSSWR